MTTIPPPRGTSVGAALAALACTLAAAAAQPERIAIEGGPVVILLVVEGAGRVVVEVVYGVGIIDDPRGIPQAAHLIEHLACVGATANDGPGETFRRLNEIGVANAETMPDLTHYDLCAPADELDFVLRVEADRLRSLRIDGAIVAQEAPRCYEEVRFVATRTPPALGKFALMAATQSWRHGLDRALVMGGLEDSPLDDLRAFHSAFYTRSNLTLVIVGEFERDAALDSVRRHFGDLPARPPVHEPIDWTRAPRDATVTWDAPATIVYLAFEPPESRAERLVLTALVPQVVQVLARHPEVLRHASTIDSSNRAWPVGRLPVFLAATLRDGADPAEARDALERRLREVLSRADSPILVQRSVQQAAARPWSFEAGELKRTAAALARAPDVSQQRAFDSVLGNSALEIGMRDLWLGPDPDALVREAEQLTAEDLAALIARTFDPERMIVTTLVPE